VERALGGGISPRVRHFTAPFRPTNGNERADIGETLMPASLRMRNSYTLFWNSQCFRESCGRRNPGKY
jgi:hypothetical protein